MSIQTSQFSSKVLSGIHANYVLAGKSSICKSLINHVAVQKFNFDPTNKDHISYYKKFKETGSWNSIRFNLEWPFNSVPSMIESKIIHYVLNS